MRTYGLMRGSFNPNTAFCENFSVPTREINQIATRSDKTGTNHSLKIWHGNLTHERNTYFLVIRLQSFWNNKILVKYSYTQWLKNCYNVTKYPRMDQVKFVQNSLKNFEIIWCKWFKPFMHNVQNWPNILENLVVWTPPDF